MGKTKKHPPVKLIIAFIFKKKIIFDEAKLLLEKKFGRIDFESEILSFTHTDYYTREFGANLKRIFTAFKKLIPPEELSDIKLFTNRLEKRLSAGINRLINIDPGYLDMSKIILASTKDYTHRIYLNKGIYAEVTLFYRDKTFRPWEWTYPDYKSAGYISLFNQIRRIYAEQAKKHI